MKYTTTTKKVRTLKDARADERVYEINKCSAYEFESAGYEINLNDGYQWDEGGGVIFADNVKEVCELINNHICYAL